MIFWNSKRGMLPLRWASGRSGSTLFDRSLDSLFWLLGRIKLLGYFHRFLDLVEQVDFGGVGADVAE